MAQKKMSKATPDQLPVKDSNARFMIGKKRGGGANRKPTPFPDFGGDNTSRLNPPRKVSKG